MELILDKNKKKEHLYLEVFHYYRELIMEKKLPPGSRMPSLRKCSQELKLSRTTIENAYLQLAAEGYIISKAQSGYYVTDIADRQHTSVRKTEKHAQTPCRFDFASSGVDRESFRFDLWRRYIKSALRQDERLLSYGEPQGEADLRDTLADYVRERRNVLCSGEDIVIGAGIQSLLHILCPLLEQRQTVSFPNPSFVQGSTVFHDYGFQVDYRNKDCDIIYVSPAHMTKWGDIMPVSRRLELVNYSAAHGSLVIEDDFENEFVYLQKPTPSLFGLAGGQNVVYLGTFSRLLLPSIRISFMVLPPELSALYRKKADQYNQTASKAEQIALTQFIRDGHLESQIRKSRKIHLAKANELVEAAKDIWNGSCELQIEEAGFHVCLEFESRWNAREIAQRARREKIAVIPVGEEEGRVKISLSTANVAVHAYREALEKIKELS